MRRFPTRSASPARAFVVALVLACAALTASAAETTVTYTDGQISATARSTTTANPLTVTIASGSATQSGVISGDGALTKTGAGTLTLTANNSYTGGTLITAGTLALGPDADIQHTGTVTIDGGTLDLGTGGELVGPLVLTSGSIIGTGSLNAASFTVYSGTISAPLVGTGIALTKEGTGTVTLTANNNYTGGTTINAGTLAVGPNADIQDVGTVTLNGGTLDLGTGNENIGPLVLNSGSIIGTGNLLAASYTVSSGSISAPLTGTGIALTKTTSGTVTLSGANTYSGGTTLSAGTLTAGSATAFGTGTVRVDAGTLALADLAVANALDIRGGTVTGLAAYTGTQTLSTTATYSGSVGGTVVVANSGILNTTGATFTGTTTVQSGGRLDGTGTVAAVTVQSGGTLAPGNSTGLLTVNGHLTLAGSTLMELAATGTRGTAYDAINAGTLTFGGTLTVSLLNGFTPTAGHSFDLLNYTTATGTFSSLNLPTLSSGLSWNTAALYTDGLLSVTASAIPEPSTYAALLGALCLAVAWRRRVALAAYRRGRKTS